MAYTSYNLYVNAEKRTMSTETKFISYEKNINPALFANNFNCTFTELAECEFPIVIAVLNIGRSFNRQ
ncbi:MAG: hypothetical protein Roseis2KO_27130 [Roseivirga sp.]